MVSVAVATATLAVVILALVRWQIALVLVKNNIIAKGCIKGGGECNMLLTDNITSVALFFYNSVYF